MNGSAKTLSALIGSMLWMDTRQMTRNKEHFIEIVWLFYLQSVPTAWSSVRQQNIDQHQKLLELVVHC